MSDHSKQSALIVQGGWDGHQPAQVAAIFERELKAMGFDVEVSDSLESFADAGRMKSLSLVVPVWTMGEITGDQLAGVCGAVESGVGLAGCHGGMCDAFRNSDRWQWMTGGQWVAHPGDTNVTYTVNLGPERGELTAGLDDFQVKSEQYYLHVDPAVKVWATTTFPVPGGEGPHEPNGKVVMPQVWTKYFGAGRVFYNALGHDAALFEQCEPALELMRRGFRWAAQSAAGSAAGSTAR